MGIPLQTILEKLPADRRKRIDDEVKLLVAEEQSLSALRKAQKLTQVRLAKKLGIKQESVSNIETRADMLISTLRGYVKAVGGELSLQVKFPDRPAVLLTTLASGRVIKKATKSTKARKRVSA
jgi:DNA-binding transcriptional regulator YiaG